MTKRYGAMRSPRARNVGTISTKPFTCILYHAERVAQRVIRTWDNVLRRRRPQGTQHRAQARYCGFSQPTKTTYSAPLMPTPTTAPQTLTMRYHSRTVQLDLAGSQHCVEQPCRNPHRQRACRRSLSRAHSSACEKARARVLLGAPPGAAEGSGASVRLEGTKHRRDGLEHVVHRLRPQLAQRVARAFGHGRGHHLLGNLSALLRRCSCRVRLCLHQGAQWLERVLRIDDVLLVGLVGLVLGLGLRLRHRLLHEAGTAR
jgi:hypothetical protein